MTDIVTFLRARLDEDQALATAAKTEIDGHGWHDTEGMCEAEVDFIPDPARVLRDVQAKRRIVGLVITGPDGEPAYYDGYAEAWRDALHLLALPYADHADYDEAWRP